MRKKYKLEVHLLDYLQLPSKVVRWQHIAGPKVSAIQMYDLIYDEYDCKIRRMPNLLKESKC